MMIISPKKVNELKRKTAGKAVIQELIDYICHLQNQIVELDSKIYALERKLEEVKDDRK